MGVVAAEVLPEEEDEEEERARLEDEGEVEVVAVAREEGLRGEMTTTTMETTTKTGAEILLLAVELPLSREFLCPLFDHLLFPKTRFLSLILLLFFLPFPFSLYLFPFG